MSIPSRRAPKPTRTAQAGFSLIELMVVMTIIGTVTALAVPAVQAARINERVFRAADSVVRLARSAQSQAVTYGRAHLVRVTMPPDTAGGGGGKIGGGGKKLGGGSSPALGSKVRIYRGTTDGCATTNWAVITAGPACGVANSQCVSQLDMTRDEWNSGGMKVRMMGPGNIDNLDFCYSGQGTPQYRSATTEAGLATAAWQIDNPLIDGLRGGFQFALAGYTGGSKYSWGTAAGSLRVIVIPWGAAARHMRGGSIRTDDYKTVLGIEASSTFAVGGGGHGGGFEM